MRKFLIIIGIILGIGTGLFATMGQDVGVKIVLTFFSTVAGVAFFGAMASIGKKKTRRTRKSLQVDDSLVGLGIAPEDFLQNYWRDQGRPQLTSPLEAEKGCHQFDPTRFGP